MISKIKIPKDALKFILDKTADFLVNRLSNKIDGREAKSMQLSTNVYERELRKDLEVLKDSIQNLEAVVYHGKRLYEMALSEINNRFENLCSSNINVYGDVSVTVNLCYFADEIQVNGKTNCVSRKDIVDILDTKVTELFVSIENKQSIIENRTTALRFSDIISKRNNELIDKRNED